MKPGAERIVKTQIKKACALVGCHMWSNSSGAALNPAGRLIRFGLANDSGEQNAWIKSSDLIGISKGGKFVAIEVKKEKWKFTGTPREVAQQNFLDLVNSRGGIAFFCNSVEDFLNKYRELERLKS